MPEGVIAATILVIGHRGIRRGGREATIVQVLPDIISACPGVPSMNASYLQPARALRTLETAVSPVRIGWAAIHCPSLLA